MRVGIVGGGMIAPVHLESLKRDPRTTVVGIADLDLVKAQQLAASYGIPGAYASMDELIEQARPDAIHLLTPPSNHRQLATRALEAGVHVYVEKPMALDRGECRAMHEAARRANRLLCVGHCFVYEPLVQRIEELLRSGKAGELLGASFVFSYDVGRNPNLVREHWSQELPGGLLEDLAVHPVSVLLRLLGPPRRFEASVRQGPTPLSVGPGEVEALWEGERALGNMTISLGARPNLSVLEVRCSRMWIRANFAGMVLTVEPQRGIPRQLARLAGNIEVAGQLLARTAGFVVRALLGRADVTGGVQSLIGAFYDAIESGGPSPVDGQEGEQAVAVLRSIWPLETGATRKEEEPAPISAPVASPSGRRVLVTGASGFLGRHLVEALRARGDAVRVLVRPTSPLGPLEVPEVDVRVGNLGDADSLAGIADGIDVVFHLGSAMYGDWPTFERIDVRGTKKLLQEAESAGVSRFVFASTLAVYDVNRLARGGSLNEDAPIDRSSRLGNYGRAKVLVEDLVLEAHRAGRVASVIVRPGVIYGPGRSAFIPHVGRPMNGRVLLFGRSRLRIPLTFVDNTVDALLLAAESEAALGEVFDVIDDDSVTRRDYLRRFTEASGQEMPVTALPAPVATLIAFGVQTLSRLRGQESETTAYRMRAKLKPLRFDSKKAREVLGWTPRVSTEEALERTFRWHLEHFPV